MRISLPRIYPITDPLLSSLSHAEQTAELIAGGARLIQIRDKTAASDAFFRSVTECIAAAEASGAKIIVNDRIDVALAAGAAGVHLGQTDLSPATARKLLGEELAIGVSTHDLEQVTSALSAPVDYIAFGPIWPTRTKTNPDPVVGLEMLSKVKKLAGDIPVVAIGGINESNIAATISAGADSVAVISDLYKGYGTIAERFGRLSGLANVKHR